MAYRSNPLSTAVLPTDHVDLLSLTDGYQYIITELRRIQLNTNSITAPMVTRIQVEIEPCNPLDWLRNQENTHRFFWCNRKNTETLAGVGIARQVAAVDFQPAKGLIFPDPSEEKEHNSVRYIVTGRFDVTRNVEEAWVPFGTIHFYLPRVEVRKVENRYFLACNLYLDPETWTRELNRAENTLNSSNARILSDRTTLPQFRSTWDTPKFESWERNIHQVLDTMKKHALKKVVLARKATHRGESLLDPVELLYHLNNIYTRSYRFCIQLKQNLGFIGVSPEQLYRRDGKIVTSEALAGTRPRGKTRKEDERLAQELMDSKKERVEQSIVEERVFSKLGSLCVEIEESDEPIIFKLPNVQHLQTIIQGLLIEDASDAQLLTTLHPTPAVGGYPKMEALKLIHEYESFDRGLYAGVVGCLGSHQSEIAVGIRSALVQDKDITVYAGAGIVPGSTPESEWTEIQNKMQLFQKILRDENE